MKDIGKVSIIIPVYNVEEYIDECLESCVNQTYKNIEIICINDGSTDASVKHIESFMRDNENIILLNQDNSGVVIARNNGIKRATGEYIMFVDSDDYIDVDMVEIMVSELIRSKTDAVKCNIDTTLEFLQYSKIENNKIYFDIEYQDLLIKELFSDNNTFSFVCNGIYKKELCGNFPKGFRLGEDVLFNAEYFLKGNSIALTTDGLYHYRDNPSSVTHKPNINTITNNLDHFVSYYYANDLLKDIEDVRLKEIFLKKVASINYMTYMRLIFQIFGITNIVTSMRYAKKYYKLYKDIFDKVEYEDVIDIVVNSYHWTDLKVKYCVLPFYKKNFFISFIGYKYIYKRLK